MHTNHPREEQPCDGDGDPEDVSKDMSNYIQHLLKQGEQLVTLNHLHFHFVQGALPTAVLPEPKAPEDPFNIDLYEYLFYLRKVQPL